MESTGPSHGVRHTATDQLLTKPLLCQLSYSGYTKHCSKCIQREVPESGVDGPSHGGPHTVVRHTATDQLLTKQLLCQLSYSGDSMHCSKCDSNHLPQH